MDDEIDIEEHDILEHPQVKALFPDISKIQIHLQEASLEQVNPEVDTQFDKRLDYTNNDIAENSTKSQDYDHNNFADVNIGDKEYTQEISDTDNDPLANVDDHTDDRIAKHILDDESDGRTKDVSNDVQVITDDEDDDLTDKTQENKLTDQNVNLNENRNANKHNNKIENIYQISDDEDEILLSDSNNVGLFEDVQKNNTFEELPDNNEYVEEILGNDTGFLRNVLEKVTTENDEFIKNAVEFTENDNTDGFLEENDYNDASGHHVDDEFENVQENYEHSENNQEVHETKTNRIQKLEKSLDNKPNRIDDNSKYSNDIYQQVSIKEEIDYELENEYFDEHLESVYNNDELPPEDIYHFKNKIILGSKPSPNNLIIKSELVVLLDDWSVHLDNSRSYCKDCQTLFTTPNALDSHRMSAHSLLAPIVINKAVKSTALSSVNVARKSTANKNDKDISNSTYCNHCNVTFKDHTTLIKHLYELLPVKKHACNICEETFKNINDLVNHNATHIKIEPRKYLKAKKNNDNPILRNMLNAMRDTSKLKRFLTVDNIVEKKVKRPIIKKDEVSTKQCRYKCLICSDVFNSYSLARGHRIAHPETPINEMLKKLPTKRANPNNSKDKLTYEDEGNGVKDIVQLIPTSALFQCSKCDIHFTTAWAGQAHFSGNKCDKTKNGKAWSCPTCKRKLRKVDEYSHTRQHEISNKIKIYKLTKNTYERSLCKCLKCNVYFEYILLVRHLAAGKCGKIPTVKCKICDINFPSYKLVEHNRKHEVMKLKRKDFIIADYVNANDRSKPAKKLKTAKTNTLVKIKQEPEVTEQTKSIKIVNKLQFEGEGYKMFYCKRCMCFLTNKNRNILKSNRFHSSKRCVKSKDVTNCQHCGLRLLGKTRISHERLHTKKNLTIKDFEFYDYATLKKISPPIPKYPRCDKCKIHFLDRDSVVNHICGEDYDNCEVCGDKYENSALAVHLPIHQVFSAKPKPVKTSPKIIPELMMKYESLNAIWNILFICGKCELVTDLYNKAVEHSQSHLNRESQPTIIKCYICNLKFEESCWHKHSALHSRMRLTNKNFKILKYAPDNLLDESWFQMFETLPEKEIRQIIDRSVFGSERSLKMRLIKDGLPEFTVYCCSNCHVAYDNNDILNHVKTKCKTSPHVCRDCNVSFNSVETLEFHDQLHVKGIKAEEFRIVHFVKNDTRNAQKTKDVPKSVKKQVKIDKTIENAQFLIYKCKFCSLCIQLKQNKNSHNCNSKTGRAFCKICKQIFSSKQKHCHKVKHTRFPEFLPKNTTIVTFEPAPEVVDRYLTSSKRRRYRTKKYIKKGKSITVKKEPTTSDDSDSEPSPDSPNDPSVHSSVLDVQSRNPTKSKARTTLNSSRSLLSTESELELPDYKRTSKLYKCDCGLHYTSLKSIEKHIETCDSSENICKENCSKCGLLFPTDILVNHLCKHHSQNTKITVEEVHKKDVTEITSQKKLTISAKDATKLYKCRECNVYFLNQSSCYKHISKHVPLDPKEYIECKMCNFQFRILSLHIHMRKHHEREFDLGKVLIEEYQPSVGKQAPKIDIYFANDRIDNVQVSSSND